MCLCLKLHGCMTLVLGLLLCILCLVPLVHSFVPEKVLMGIQFLKAVAVCMHMDFQVGSTSSGIEKHVPFHCFLVSSAAVVMASASWRLALEGSVESFHGNLIPSIPYAQSFQCLNE